MEENDIKILHYSLGLPPFRSGGLTKYSVDLMESQVTQGHDVCLLYPGEHSLFCKTKINENKSYKGIHIFEIVNPLPVPLLNGIKDIDRFIESAHLEVYESFLLRFNPDVVHIHSFMGLHKEFLLASKKLGIKIVFTTHDYFGLCPKASLFTSSENVCRDFMSGEQCIKCNESAFSYKMIFILQSKLYRRFKEKRCIKLMRKMKKNHGKNKSESHNQFSVKKNDSMLAEKYRELREYYLSMYSMIDEFHFNSSIAREVFESHLSNIDGECIPITHNEIRDNRVARVFQKENPLRITFLGPMESYKGFNLLENSLKLLLDEGQKSWRLNLYGDNNKDVGLLDEYYHLHGKYDYQSQVDIFAETDLLVVPSMWKETYGFTGLEGISYGVPTLISENVGVKDIIEDGKTGIVFSTKTEELADKINLLINNREILQQVNVNIIKSEFNYLMKHHSNKIIDLYTR